MKNILGFMAIIALFISCNKSGKDTDSDTMFKPFPLDVPEQNSLMAGWEKKEVLASRLIDDMEQQGKWQKTGIGEMSYTAERARDGKQSLRFRTSLRDEEHYRKNRTDWDSFGGSQGGSSSIQLQFSEPQDWSEYNRISFWAYVHPTSMPTYCFVVSFACEGAISNATTQRMSHFVQDLKPGEWNHVMYEIPHLQRDKVTRLVISQTLRGHNPEEEGIVTYDIDQIELQQVQADKYEGWEVSPGKFSFSHIGYRPEEPKIAMVGEGGAEKFDLIDAKGEVVFSGNVKTDRNSRGNFRMLDFSGFDTPGEYSLRCGDLESGTFPINDQVWQQPVFKAINFFFCERCGFAVPGVHLECHKDWQGFYGDKKLIINGGWHDAGDLSQGSFRTAMASLAMMKNLEALQGQAGNEELVERIRAELAWGLEWLLKTRFGDGYHMSFSVMRIYTDNQVGTIDDVVSPAANIPWENFLAAAVQCKAAMMLEKTHPELAGRARTAALEDWQVAADSCDARKKLNYREASWGTSASILLRQMTGEEKYAEHAIRYGAMLVNCQEQSFVDGIPITGYFYNDTERKSVIHNHHAAFEEAPIIALAMLCREFPGHEDWMKWYSAAVLHSEYFMKRGSKIAAPFNLLPNSVWKKSDILADTSRQRQSDMLRQFNDGTKLNDEYALRTFPIYRDNLFHGNTNIHMSSTWALAEASRLRHDEEGMRLVGQQFNWVLGANPFGQSLMYGVGYDFAPHFAYCLKDIVGSLPVGMDCMSGDQPHWSATNNATYKEIWVEPVNRFLGAVSVYTSWQNEPPARDSVRISAEKVASDRKTISFMVTLSGNGKHEIDIKAFNLTTNINYRQVDLADPAAGKILMEATIQDPKKPYVLLIMVDENPELTKEITGALVENKILLE